MIERRLFALTSSPFRHKKREKKLNPSHEEPVMDTVVKTVKGKEGEWGDDRVKVDDSNYGEWVGGRKET